MIVIGFGLGWVGYTLAFWGHGLIKGYNLSFSDIASPTGYYKGKWPPPLAADTVLIPTGKASDSGDASAASGDQAGGKNPIPCPPGFKLIAGRCMNPNQAPGR